jgi:hypothetical protein
VGKASHAGPRGDEAPPRTILRSWTLFLMPKERAIKGRAPAQRAQLAAMHAGRRAAHADLSLASAPVVAPAAPATPETAKSTAKKLLGSMADLGTQLRNALRREDRAKKSLAQERENRRESEVRESLAS